MDRRVLIATGLAAAAGAPAFAQGQVQSQSLPPPSGAPNPPPPQGAQPPAPLTGPSQPAPSYATPGGPTGQPPGTYSNQELTDSVSNFFGVTAENAGAIVERLFHENGRPTAYIAGREGSGAFIFGLRYGKGLMYMKDRPNLEVYWQGPTGGFDFGANASRVFTLCYDLEYPDAIFRRFPGVEGSAYLVGGLGVNYQRADGITLAPIRAGLGLRLGANIGYLAYSRQRNVIPL
ncbi:MAG TPA: DUF1134 domain-containing protein [Caulobacteraceae bacterium]|jgi:hypothetical protein